MCFYITATLPKETKIDDFRDILDKYNMEFSKIHNPAVESQLRLDELYFRATKDYCDCDTPLGALNKLQDFQNLYNLKKVKTLRKKNWSEEEINKWIDQKLKNKSKKTGKKLSSMEIKERTNRWISFLHDLLDNKIVLRIGVLKHWYNRGLEEEKINIKKTKKISINEITSDYLLTLEEDVLYEFLPVYSF
ncbi:MAG: hypothetical protein ACFFG0_13895 [Candidatus Thorarchaeota archaeon]